MEATGRAEEGGGWGKAGRLTSDQEGFAESGQRPVAPVLLLRNAAVAVIM